MSIKFLTANQQYKKSNSTLPFKSWLEREKSKGRVFRRDGITEDINDALSNKIKETRAKITTEPTNDTKPSSNKIFGLDKRILMLSGIIIVSAIAYKTYKSK